MKTTMRYLAATVIGVAVVRTAGAADDGFTYADGPFKASWESLQNYQCPEWFRDAKFGIWAHWGPQCQPEQGDWYAKHMYEQGNRQYQYHVEHYGHPSKFGFKDICHAWKAAHFDPEKLIALYKRAGAQYFVAMANHHDNFDNFNSCYQPWNSVNIGPKKDLVGLWAKAARAAGLHFGVTVHAGRAWSWYEVAQGADKTGPLAGVKYDGVLTKADGKGQWWDGLDPQDLYAQNHPLGAPPSRDYAMKFFLRVKDLIDSYQPDLLYFDDGVLPLRRYSEEVGLGIAAHLYNTSAERHGGQAQTVMTTKGLNEEQRRCLVWDIERGKAARVEPYTWQTDTCIGGWHYNRPIFEHHGYKTAAQVVPMLVDIVSKNGCLLLNIPVRGDGAIDEDETSFLEDMAAWTSVNGECIYGTRPWKIYGEGPAAAARATPGRHGGIRDTNGRPYTPADIRFTTKGNTLYAITFGWPTDGKLTVRTLAAGASGIRGEVTGVALLGSAETLGFRREAEGLVVVLPTKKPCEHAWALKISGLDLAASEPVMPKVAGPGPVKAAKDGSLVLGAAAAEMHGERVHVEARGGKPNVGFWDNPAEYISWKARLAQAGAYDVVAVCASPGGGQTFTVEAGGRKLQAQAAKTGAFDRFTDVSVGRIAIDKAGDLEVVVRPAHPAKWKAINLRTLRFIPVK